MYSTRVVLSTANNGHPVYNTYIRWSTSSDEWCIAHRFAGYRDLCTSMTDLGVIPTAPFPPTYSKSKFGIQLTARELEDRRAMLETWVCELLTNHGSFPEHVRYQISQFFELEAHPAPVVRPSSPKVATTAQSPALASAAPAAGAPTPEAHPPQQRTPEPKPGKKVRTQSNMSTVSEPAKEAERQASGELPRTQSARGDLRSILSEKFMSVSGDAFRKDKTKSVKATQPAPPPKPDKLHVAVRRGEEHKGHPMYDTRLQFVRAGVGYTVTHRFAAFRTLETDLKQAQVVVQAPFPTTHAKSSFGLKLSEPELQERARHLDLWMKEVLTSYHTYPDRAQLLIYDFLKLESCTNSEVEQSLTEGRVVANIEDADKDDFEENQDILEEQEELVPASTTGAAVAATPVAAKVVVVPNISTASSTDQPHESVDDAQAHPLNEKPSARPWWSCRCC